MVSPSSARSRDALREAAGHDPAPPWHLKEGKHQKANCFPPEESLICLNLSHLGVFEVFFFYLLVYKKVSVPVPAGSALALWKGAGMESGTEDGWILNCF